MTIIRRYRDGKIVTIDLTKQNNTGTPPPVHQPSSPIVNNPVPSNTPTVPAPPAKKGCGCGKKK